MPTKIFTAGHQLIHKSQSKRGGNCKLVTTFNFMESQIVIFKSSNKFSKYKVYKLENSYMDLSYSEN